MKLRCSEMCADSRENPVFKVIILVDDDCDVVQPMEALDTSEARCAHCNEAAVNVNTTPDILERLEYLRSQLNAECISLDELHELQSLKVHIDFGDVRLLEAAGVPEFSEEDDG